MLPGQIGWSAPKGEDAIIRRIADLERSVLELGPSIAKSFNGTVAALTATQGTLATTVASLTATQGTLSTTVAGLAAAVLQLNAASESKTSYLAFTPASTPDSQSARTDYDAVTVTFTKPAWATKGVILAFSTFTGTDSPTAGFTPTIKTRIFSVDSTSVSRQLPNPLAVRDSAGPTTYTAFDVSPASTVIPFTQSFTMGAATTASASLRITKAASGSGSAFTCTITATVFWTAT